MFKLLSILSVLIMSIACYSEDELYEINFHDMTER
jgi:hypothetical protein